MEPEEQYPDDAERPDGTVEPDENDNSTPLGVPPVGSKIADGEPGDPEVSRI
jgi:hypothetical protein